MRDILTAELGLNNGQRRRNGPWVKTKSKMLQVPNINKQKSVSEKYKNGKCKMYKNVKTQNNEKYILCLN